MNFFPRFVSNACRPSTTKSKGLCHQDLPAQVHLAEQLREQVAAMPVLFTQKPKAARSQQQPTPWMRGESQNGCSKRMAFLHKQTTAELESVFKKRSPNQTRNMGLVFGDEVPLPCVPAPQFCRSKIPMPLQHHGKRLAVEKKVCCAPGVMAARRGAQHEKGRAWGEVRWTDMQQASRFLSRT